MLVYLYRHEGPVNAPREDRLLGIVHRDYVFRVLMSTRELWRYTWRVMTP